jgi:hypothetical protein
MGGVRGGVAGIIDAQPITTNGNQVLTGVLVHFDGQPSAHDARTLSEYHLVAANPKGLFSGKNTHVVKLKSAMYDGDDQVTLTLKKPFNLTTPLEITVLYVDVNVPRSVVISKEGVKIQAELAPATGEALAGGAVDALLERGDLVSGNGPFRT